MAKEYDFNEFSASLNLAMCREVANGVIGPELGKPGSDANVGATHWRNSLGLGNATSLSRSEAAAVVYSHKRRLENAPPRNGHMVSGFWLTSRVL